MSELVCANCGSDFISARLYWKPQKYLKNTVIDVYLCGDCGSKIDPVTKDILPEDWMPPLLIAKTNKQVGLFGETVNDQDYVYETWRPYITRAFDGTWFNGVYRMSKEQHTAYSKILHKMQEDLIRCSKTVEVPDWHKYRESKYRVNNYETLDLVAGQIGSDEQEQWEYLDRNFSHINGLQITYSGYFYILKWKKEKNVQKVRSNTRRRKSRK